MTNEKQLCAKCLDNGIKTYEPCEHDKKDELNEDDAMEREHDPVEYYSEPELPSEHNL